MKAIVHRTLSSLFLIVLICIINAKPLRYNLVQGLQDIYISPASEKIGQTWIRGNVHDKPLIQKFYSLLAAEKEFFVVIDIGAQTGSFSLLANYFPNSKWYAFEPIKEAAHVLKKNLHINNIKNVSVYHLAASDVAGKTTLKMPAKNAWGLSTMGSKVLRFDTIAEEREVTSIDLDSFVAAKHIKKVHFMKLDTEGWEFYILRGAKQIIMRDHPIMLIEYNETNMKQCGVSKSDMDNLLKEMGYEWQLISTEDILCTPVRS